MLAQWWRNNNLTFASGPAGRGKTSLLLAGVVPLLAQDPLGGTPHILPVGSLSYGLTFPVTALPAHNPYTLSLLRSWAPGESPTRLAGLTVRQFVAGIAGRATILAAIDPADELAIASGPGKRHLRGLLAELKDALRAEPRLHLLLVGREQTAAAVEKVLGGTRYEVPPLSWQSAVDAVTGQFRSAGRALTADAAEKFVTDVSTSPMGGGQATERDPEGLLIEPALFRVACDQLWESLPADADPVTTQDMQRRTDVDAALAEHASAVLAEVADQQGLSVKRLADWLTESFITELGTENLQYEGAAKTARMPNGVARALEDRHLLVSSQQSGSRWYKLSSARLIEPLRQLNLALPARAAWRPAADLRELLSTAERAFARGDLALARRLASAVLAAAESEQKPVAPRYAESGLAHSLLGNIAYEGGKPVGRGEKLPGSGPVFRRRRRYQGGRLPARRHRSAAPRAGTGRRSGPRAGERGHPGAQRRDRIGELREGALAGWRGPGRGRGANRGPRHRRQQHRRPARPRRDARLAGRSQGGAQ